MKYLNIGSFLLLSIFMFLSCENNEMKPGMEGSRIHQILQKNGTMVTHFIYSADGNLSETESNLSYSRYTYSDGKLFKEETATDPNLLSSTIYNEKSEFMTAENAEINSYSDYEYAPNGQILSVKNYLKVDNGFEYRSRNTFEYENGKIVRKNLHDKTDKITQQTVYQYDAQGNVILEQSYSFLNSENKPELISEAAYRLDEKSNPFMIYSQLGVPGLFSNPNNIVEVNVTRYTEVKGFENQSVSNSYFEYNSFGYPVKETNGISTFLYVYE